MRWHRKLLTLAAMAALCAPQLAAADEVQDQLQEMKQRMNQLEDRLQATTDQLQATEKKSEEQQAVIDRSGIKNTTTGSSKIASFLETLNIGGWVSGAYWYNANNPAGQNLKNANIGAGSSPLNPDANTFEFEQAWFELERPISPENRAGFRFDIGFGQVASILNQVNVGTTCAAGAPGVGGSQNPSRNTCNVGSALYVAQAYVQYLIPWQDLTFKAGQFNTPFGYEVPQAAYNWQVSRGLLWNLLQPISHTGVILSKTYDNGISWAVGGVNGFGFSQQSPDNNQSKSVLAQVGLAQDMWSVQATGLWGPETTGSDHQTRTTLDLVATLKPLEGTQFAFNADYAILNGITGAQHPGPQYSPDAWGVALYGRQAITDKLGISIRGEYVQDHNSFFCNQTGFFCLPAGANGTNPLNPLPVSATNTNFWPDDNAKVYEVTGTIDYSITQQLIVKTEIRWDAISSISGASSRAPTPTTFPPGGGPGFTGVGYINNQTNGLFNYNHQLLAGAEILYKF